MWWNIEGDRPEVHFPVGVDAGDDEEDSGAFGTSFAQTTEAKYDGPLVLLDNLKTTKITFERRTLLSQN